MQETRQQPLRHFRYLPQLDGVRALAVAVVVLAHAQLPFAKGGGIGVDVFFVLSGYLITTLLLEEANRTGRISLPEFYRRRVRRLLPALLAVSAFTVVSFLIVRPFETNSTLLGVGASLVYMAAWLRAYDVSTLGWFGHTWSLSIEEHFYLVWPLALLILVRKRVAHLKYWIVALFLLAVAYRTLSALAGASNNRLNNSPDLRAEQLLAGCALAALLFDYVRREGWWDKVWLALVVVSLADLARWVVLPDLFGSGSYRTLSTVIGVESALIIGYLAVHPLSRLTSVLSLRPLVWTGRRSYAIYLWHLPLFGLLSLRGEPGAIRAGGRGAAVVLTFVAAWASFQWVERPFYRRRVGEPDEQGGRDGFPSGPPSAAGRTAADPPPSSPSTETLTGAGPATTPPSG